MPLIELSNATIGFANKIVMRNLSVSIKPLSFICVTGPNGSGKTTIIQVLAGLLKPLSGTYCRQKRLTIGYLPQNRSIDRRFPITVREVLLSGLQNKKSMFGRFSSAQLKHCDDLLQRLDLSDLANRPIHALSGGQWQRTLIGRAIISDPDVLLLDEPETYLDVNTKNFLYELLEDQNQKSAIVYVSHEQYYKGRELWKLTDDGELNIVSI